MPGIIRSWGRYPPVPQAGTPVTWTSQVADRLDRLRHFHGTTLAWGNGRSYGDSCLAASDHVLEMGGLDRFVEADWSTGRIRAQAGLLLDELIRIALPQGWFPPVTPGTRFVTLGGALANDVHGKNHHHVGTLGHHVTRFGLVRSDNGYHEIDPSAHPELFAATIGGLGLTGVITWVELQLLPVSGSTIETRTYRFRNLDEFLDLSNQLDSDSPYTVAWVDCLAPRRQLGRGLFMTGAHTDRGILRPPATKRRTMPVDPPASLVNRLSVRLFNNFTYWRPRQWERPVDQNYEAFFYPLDQIQNWNRIYGRNGFQQFQCVVPEANAPGALTEIMETVRDHRQGSFLAVLKRCGDWTPAGKLSFPRAGLSLALDFAQRGDTTSNLLSRLDSIVEATGGRLYPAKDAHMSPAFFRAAYPNWTEVERLRDPALLSRFWARVMQ